MVLTMRKLSVLALCFSVCAVSSHGHATHDHHAHVGHDHQHHEHQLTAATVEKLAQLLRTVQAPEEPHEAHNHNHSHSHGTHAHAHAGHAHHGHAHNHSHSDTTLSVQDLLGPEHSEAQLSNSIASHAITELVRCAQDPHCQIATRPTSSTESHPEHAQESVQAAGAVVTPSTKAWAAAALFLETIVGMVIPPLISHMDGHAWWLSLLNCFSGGIFLTAGLVHLVPHCEEAQMDVDLTNLHLPSHYPLYLLLVCAGYLLVFAVERVVFEGHDHGHGHSHSHDAHDHKHSHGNHKSHADVGDAFSPTASWEKGGGVRKRCVGASCGDAAHGHSGTKQPGDAALAKASTGAVEEHHDHQHQHEFSAARGIPLLVGMSVHTFLECLALGLISRPASFAVLLTAIAAHKGVSALALAAKFTKEGATLKQVLLLVGPFTLVAPTAIAAGHVAGSSLPATLQLVLNCLAAGTFLYVGASEILSEEFEGDPRAGRRDLSKAAARAIKFLAVLVAVGCIAAMGLMPHVH